MLRFNSKIRSLSLLTLWVLFLGFQSNVFAQVPPTAGENPGDINSIQNQNAKDLGVERVVDLGKTTAKPESMLNSGERPLDEGEFLARLAGSGVEVLSEPPGAEKAKEYKMRPGHFSASFMTFETVKFYMAVAAIQIGKCSISGDPTICNALVDQLEDPHTYIGFVLFMLGQEGTSVGLQKLANYAVTKGVSKAAAGRFLRATGMLGMGVGLFVSDIYHQLAYKLEERKFFSWKTTSDERQEILKEVYHETVADPLWREDRMIDLAGLIFSGAVSQIFHKPVRGTVGLGMKYAVRPALNKSGRLMLHVGNTFRSETAAKIGGWLVREGEVVLRYKNAAPMGIRVFWNMRHVGLRALGITPWTILGTAVVETMIFLGVAEVVGDKLHTWNERYRRKLPALNNRLDEINRQINILEVSEKDSDPQALKRAIKMAQLGWGDYRSSLMMHSMQKMMSFKGEMDKLDHQFTKVQTYYAWILEGMHVNETFLHNPGDWHADRDPEDPKESFFWAPQVYRKMGGRPGESSDFETEDDRGDLSKEMREMTDAFFCGKLNHETAIEKTDYRLGIRLDKLRRRATIHPPRAVSIPWLCPDEAVTVADQKKLYQRLVPIYEKYYKDWVMPESRRRSLMAPAWKEPEKRSYGLGGEREQFDSVMRTLPMLHLSVARSANFFETYRTPMIEVLEKLKTGVVNEKQTLVDIYWVQLNKDIAQTLQTTEVGTLFANRNYDYGIVQSYRSEAAHWRSLAEHYRDDVKVRDAFLEAMRIAEHGERMVTELLDFMEKRIESATAELQMPDLSLSARTNEFFGLDPEQTSVAFAHAHQMITGFFLHGSLSNEDR